MTQSSEERLRRWRLILGGGEADGICTGAGGTGSGSAGEAQGVGFSLSAADKSMDDALSALYDSDREGNLGSSSPKVARWLGDIRSYFPTSVVKIMQKDALERLNLRPCYDHTIAEEFAELGVPSFACTPNQFPDLMAAAISRQDRATIGLTQSARTTSSLLIYTSFK